MTTDETISRRSVIAALAATLTGGTIAALLTRDSDDTQEEPTPTETKTPDSKPRPSKGDPPTEHITEFHVLDTDFTENQDITVRFENEGSVDADLANYDIHADVFGETNQYVNTVTGDEITGDSTIAAGGYQEVVVAVEFEGDVVTYDVRVTCPEKTAKSLPYCTDS